MKIDVPKEIKNKENRAGVVAISLAYFVAGDYELSTDINA